MYYKISVSKFSSVVSSNVVGAGCFFLRVRTTSTIPSARPNIPTTGTTRQRSKLSMIVKMPIILKKRRRKEKEEVFVVVDVVDVTLREVDLLLVSLT